MNTLTTPPIAAAAGSVEPIRAAMTATVDVESRTITGVATLIGQPANASTGRVQFEAGSLHFPETLSNVKLCIEHDHHRAVGYATRAEVVGDRLEMSFYLPEGPQGDEALASAANRVRDGLSVGAFPEDDGVRYVHGSKTAVVTNAIVREVSLTAIPAFDAARVTDVKATADAGHDAEPPAAAPGAVRLDNGPALHTGRVVADVRAAAREVVELVATGADAGAVMAALNITTIDDDAGTAWIGRPTWLGKLWEAVRADRPLISCLNSMPLGRTTKVKGWQWETRPQVGDWAGKGTAVPSNKVKTKAVEDGVLPIAGGWEVDRMIMDLGDPGFIEALFTGAAEDYALKSEAKVTAKLLPQATKLTASNDLVPALVALGTAAAARAARLDFICFAADVWAKFAELKRDEVPWWIAAGDSLNLSTTSGTVNSLRLFVNTALPTGTVFAGDSRAATFYENAVPIRVNAVNLPNGTMDLGLFGYCGVIVNDPASLLKIEAA